jgi:hypothetical protein
MSHPDWQSSQVLVLSTPPIQITPKCAAHSSQNTHPQVTRSHQQKPPFPLCSAKCWPSFWTHHSCLQNPLQLHIASQDFLFPYFYVAFRH